MNHGIVDVFAYQEALLVMTIFGIAVLAMIWLGFRRWLQYKEKMGRLIADRTAERAAQYGAQMERVEARLDTIEQSLTPGAIEPPSQADAQGAAPAVRLRGQPAEHVPKTSR